MIHYVELNNKEKCFWGVQRKAMCVYIDMYRAEL